MEHLQYERVRVDEEDEEERQSAQRGGEGLGLPLDENSSLREKAAYVVALSLPVCVSFLLVSVNNFILMYFAGHLDTSSADGLDITSVFAAISLANMYANVTGFAFLNGMSTAVDTLASQSNGARRYEEVGITIFRCVFVLAVLVLPVVISWAFVEKVFLLIRVDPVICKVAQVFLRIRAFSLPVDILNISYSKFLTAIGKMEPAMYSALLSSVVLIASSVVLTSPSWGLLCGFRGLGWAMVTSSYIGTVILIVVSWREREVQRTMVVLQKPRRLLAVFNKSELKHFVYLGIPGCAMICSEWWAFEVLTVFASRLGAVAVSAQSIMLQLVVLAFMLPLGISVAASSMVGNALGAKRKLLAIQLSKTCLAMILTLELGVIGPMTLWLGPSFVAIFTKDAAVIQMAESSAHFLALLVVEDGLQGVASGIMRGTGKQLTGALTNLFSYYCVGLPVAWLLCFRIFLGLGGLLLGIALGATAQSLILVGLILAGENWIFQATVTQENGDVDTRK